VFAPLFELVSEPPTAIVVEPSALTGRIAVWVEEGEVVLAFPAEPGSGLYTTSCTPERSHSDAQDRTVRSASVSARAENPNVKNSVAASFTPADSPMTLEDHMASAERLVLSTPDVEIGQAATDFALPVHDFSGGHLQPTGQVLRLIEVARNQPVALIFGSYT
jgi:hypothetical protein